MPIVEQHQSPDGLLRFVVEQLDGGDLCLGFADFPWHTHADILATSSGLTEDVAVRQFVDALLGGQFMIGVARVGGRITDVWVAEAATPNQPKLGDETIEFRYWDGHLAG
jgi:hypothetical protein